MNEELREQLKELARAVEVNGEAYVNAITYIGRVIEANGITKSDIEADTELEAQFKRAYEVIENIEGLY